MRKLKIFNYFCLSLVMLIGFITIVASGGGGGGSDDATDDTTTIDPYEIEPSTIETFSDNNDDICMEDGKPVIRLFSTTWCQHCQWVADTFDAVVQMYVDEGSIVAYHWQVDTGDNTLTSQVEDSVPESELDIFDTFNPNNSIPTFVFGCKYYRIGTAHEVTDDLEAEAAEFMAVIEELLDSLP